MSPFLPDIPPDVAETIRHLPPAIKRSIKQAIRVLSEDPDAGEPLRRELAGLWKYRVRRYRIVYLVDRPLRSLRIVAIGQRRRIYQDVAEQVRRK